MCHVRCVNFHKIPPERTRKNCFNGNFWFSCGNKKAVWGVEGRGGVVLFMGEVVGSGVIRRGRGGSQSSRISIIFCLENIKRIESCIFLVYIFKELFRVNRSLSSISRLLLKIRYRLVCAIILKFLIPICYNYLKLYVKFSR